MTQNLPNSGYNPKNPYQIAWNDAQNVTLVETTTGKEVYPVSMPCTTSLYGFERSYCP